MADLEERVTTPERERTALKTRVGTNEDDMQSIADLIGMEFRLGNSRIARLSRDVAELQRQVGELSDLPAKSDALPRVVAGLVSEMLAERDKKR